MLGRSPLVQAAVGTAGIVVVQVELEAVAALVAIGEGVDAVELVIIDAMGALDFALQVRLAEPTPPK